MPAGLGAVGLLATVLIAPALGTDSRGASETRANYAFVCDGDRVTLEHRQLFNRTAPDMLRSGRRVELKALTVRGRSISASSLVRLRILFEAFEWLEAIESSCYNGTQVLSFRAMPKAVWVDFIKSGGGMRPKTRPYKIEISPSGDVTVG